MVLFFLFLCTFLLIGELRQSSFVVGCVQRIRCHKNGRVVVTADLLSSLGVDEIGNLIYWATDLMLTPLFLKEGEWSDPWEHGTLSVTFPFLHDLS